MGKGNVWVLALPECLNCSRMSSSLYLGRCGLGEGRGESGVCSGREEGDAEGCRERCWGDTQLWDMGEDSSAWWFCTALTPAKAIGEEGVGEFSGPKRGEPGVSGVWGVLWPG